MDDRLETQERTQAEPGWWEKKDSTLHDLATTDDCLIDPIDSYTARYAFSTGEWDHKIYNFEDQTREEAIRLCRCPTPAVNEDRRMLYGEAWFGNAYYPFKDKNANSYMKPFQSQEEIIRLLALADAQEKDCVSQEWRARIREIDEKYGISEEQRWKNVVAWIKEKMEKLAEPIESHLYDFSAPAPSLTKRTSRIDKLEESLAAALARIDKLEEEVAFLKTNSKLLTSDELAIKNGNVGEVIQTASPTPELPDQV